MKPLSYPLRRSFLALLCALPLAAFFTACSSDNVSTSAHVTYGVGYYDPWRWGPGYYGGSTIIIGPGRPPSYRPPIHRPPIHRPPVHRPVTLPLPAPARPVPTDVGR